MKPGGAFEAKTTSLSGTLTLGTSKPALLKGEISVDLATIDTGIGLRNQHLREKYLEISRGRGFDQAVLSEIRLDQADGEGFQGKTGFTGKLLLHGVSRDVAGTAEIRREGADDARGGELPADPHRFRDRAARVPGRGGREQAARQGPLHRDARIRPVSRGRIFFLCRARPGRSASSRAAAEPIFLSRQYTRCTNCHYSPTGGGLLTPYGRSLSREELSTFGASRWRGHPRPRAGLPVRRARQGPRAGQRRDRPAAGASLHRFGGVQLVPRLPDERGPRRRPAVPEVDLLRPGRPPAARGRDARHLVRALGHVPVGQGRRGSASAASCRPTASSSPTTPRSRARRSASTTTTRSTAWS